MTVKATALDAALGAVPPEQLGDATIIPLLNGIDHVARLREVYGAERVVAGAIRSDTERVAPGRIRAPALAHAAARRWRGTAAGRAAPVELAASGAARPRGEAIAAELTAAGVPCAVRDDESLLLWSKLVGIASGGPGGGARRARRARRGPIRSCTR